MGETELIYPGRLFSGEGIVGMNVLRLDSDTENIFSTRFRRKSDSKIRVTMTGNGIPLVSVVNEIDDISERDALMPMLYQTNGDFDYIIQDFPNNDRLPRYVILYLYAYILGMLVRYFPTKWMSLVNGEKGDAARPLIYEVIDLIECDWPGAVTKSLS